MIMLVIYVWAFVVQATPDMAVTLLEIARIFATKVPGKIDADVLQLLWKVCFLTNGFIVVFSYYVVPLRLVISLFPPSLWLK